MQKKETKLKTTDFCYRSDNMDVYHTDNSRVRIFSTVEDFITEQTCFKLSKIETKFILLPKPIYNSEDEYVGCATEWKNEDWINSFYFKGKDFKENLIKMREEIILLSSLGYDIGSMPFYCSRCDSNRLVFDGTMKIKESFARPEEIKRRNIYLFQDYLRNLVYNGMCEFDIDADFVLQYLYMSNLKLDEHLIDILGGDSLVGHTIRKDIKEKLFR